MQIYGILQIYSILNLVVFFSYCSRGLLIDQTYVNGNQKCSDFGNSECSIFGIKTTVLLASAVQ